MDTSATLAPNVINVRNTMKNKDSAAHNIHRHKWTTCFRSKLFPTITAHENYSATLAFRMTSS